MQRLDTTRAPDRDAVEQDLDSRFHGSAHLHARGWWSRRPRGGDRTILAAEVRTGGRAQDVWLDLPLQPPGPPPPDFRVVAVIAAHNEEDVLGWVVRRMVAEGVDVVVLDHASDDGTPAVIDELDAEGLLRGHEKVPEPWMWGQVLQRKVEVVRELGAAWGIHNDADEVRSGPWPGATLREAFWAADRFGANTVDFTVVNHLPVRGGPDGDPDRLTHVDLPLKSGYFAQRKAWRSGADVDLGGSGGHQAGRADPVVFPLNFRCDHYPVRSQEHGRRKVEERRQRRARERIDHPRRHHQYDHVADDHDFLVAPGELPIASDDWVTTNRARLLFRSGMTPDADYRLV